MAWEHELSVGSASKMEFVLEMAGLRKLSPNNASEGLVARGC